jgi:copper homeostasis protein
MKNGITLELCIENGTRLKEFTAAGVDRVELNDNMAVGGTTVSYGVAESVISRCHEAGIKVMSMIRPRGGDFVYDSTELGIMLRDLEILKTLGSDGVVFGCLTGEGLLDKEKILALLRAAEGMTAVFHMAFDHIRGGGGSVPSTEQIEGLHWLAEKGVKRILTRGSPAGTSSAWDNREKIKTCIVEAAGAIEILPGGGVTKDNYRELCAFLGTSQVHGSRLI